MNRATALAMLRASIATLLAASLVACGAAVPDPVPIIPAESDPIRGLEAPRPLYTAPIRAESLAVATDDGRVIGFDTPNGEVMVTLQNDAAPITVAQRAQLGCLGIAPNGVVHVVAVERDEASPASELVLHRYEPTTGAPVGDAVRVPALWPEPGARCALVPTGAQDWPFALLARARGVEPGAVMDLWFAPFDRPGVALGLAPHVPDIRDVAPLNRGALVVAHRIERTGDDTKGHVYELYQIGANGSHQRLPLGAPAGCPITVASEARTVMVAWLQPGLLPLPGATGSPHATLRATIVPRAHDAAMRLGEPDVRVDIYEPVDRSARPVLAFAEGRWWAILAPEPYTLRGQTEPAPYHEWLLPVEEGRAAPRSLPIDLYGAQLTSWRGAPYLVGTGVVDEVGTAAGVQWGPWLVATVQPVDAGATDSLPAKVSP